MESWLFVKRSISLHLHARWLHLEVYLLVSVSDHLVGQLVLVGAAQFL